MTEIKEDAPVEEIAFVMGPSNSKWKSIIIGILWISVSSRSIC